MAGATILSDRAGYSIVSAVPSTGTGSAIDCRARRDVYAYVFITGGSAVVNVQASHSIAGDSAWLPIKTITALDGVGTIAASISGYYPYVRGFFSGYAGATSTIYVAAGLG